MLARRLPTILPPLTLAEALETTKIHSVAGILSPETALVHTRPFRSPHHTISDTAMTGGTSNPKPGEITNGYIKDVYKQLLINNLVFYNFLSPL